LTYFGGEKGKPKNRPGEINKLKKRSKKTPTGTYARGLSQTPRRKWGERRLEIQLKESGGCEEKGAVKPIRSKRRG